MERCSRFCTNSKTTSPLLLNAQNYFSQHGVQHNSYTCNSLSTRKSRQTLSCTQFSSSLHSIRVSPSPETREINNSKAAQRSNSSNMCADMGSHCPRGVFISQLVSVPKAARLEGVCSHLVTKDLINMPDVTQG